MRPDPLGSQPADPLEDDGLLFEGLERAVEQARTKIPDHDSAPDPVFPGPAQVFELSNIDVPAAPFDSSAVMEVLRGAIDRYTNGDGHEQGAWSDELAQARDNSTGPIVERPVEAGYAPDRRRLAAVVVVLFLIAGGLGFMQLASDKSDNVTTNTVVTVTGQSVTTFTLPSTTAPTTTAAPTTDTSAAPAGTVKPAATTTTVRKTTTTTAPTTTTDPCAVAGASVAPAATSTTAATTTTTTEPPTTEPTTTEPPTTDPCAAAN